QRPSIRYAPIAENGTSEYVHTPQCHTSRILPSPKPVSPAPTYCTPSSSPVAVAAAFLPPKSIDAVPDNMPCTPKIHTHENPIMNAATPFDVTRPSTRRLTTCPR